MGWKSGIQKRKYIRLAVIAGLVVIVDQISKAVILGKLSLHRPIPIIPGCFNLTLVFNPGGAFGFLAGGHSTLRHAFFLGATSLAIGFILFLYRKIPAEQTLLATAFALIIGGAVGNLIDRLRFEKVVDFLDFYIGSFHWPAFNVADSAISVGMAIFVYCLIFNKIPG